MTETLGFVLSDLSHQMRRVFDVRARKLSVTRAQWKTLFVLSRAEGVNQGMLAEKLDVEPITACRMVDRLEEAGLVERRRDPADRRAWLIYLTETARPLVSELRALGDQLNEDALQGIDTAEREQLLATLAKVRANLTNDPQDLNETANG
ncbi:MarR family transcriptional regulator [Sphingomonas sp. AOB5]|uniref:MarR family winged helix-turn-helix transcriptional regulator n=1 Tax=Sphingomonas sp. AOB5 TaxID=3034017 RepID=UPI0023F9188E|nr:MarR family transcriptional regulator [Sphingomonas sp. AOB5]MDF7776529.1 MarR family transcriptional regulator [Sphingomonas sp. AOB5]